MNLPTANSRLVWRKSSRSASGPNQNCVEVAHLTGDVAVRDSKRPNVVLKVDHPEWNALLAALRIEGKS